MDGGTGERVRIVSARGEVIGGEERGRARAFESKRRAEMVSRCVKAAFAFQIACAALDAIVEVRQNRFAGI